MEVLNKPTIFPEEFDTDLEDEFIEYRHPAKEDIRAFSNWRIRHMMPEEHKNITQAILQSAHNLGISKETLAITPQERDELFRSILEAEDEN